MNQNNKDIDENLLLQYLLGNADDTVREKVENWLKADEGNRKHLDRLEALWLKTGQIEPPPLPVDVSAAWERMSARIDKHEATSLKQSSGPAPLRYMKYVLGAAAIILLAFGIYGVFRLSTAKVNNVEIMAGNTLIYDTLPDNSHIMLNKQSKLSYPGRFGNKQRVVKLSGEAYFEVAKDPSKPFVVDAGRARVQVLGTKFNVSVYKGQAIIVTVNEGRVKFFSVNPAQGDTLSLILEAGMTAELVPGSYKPELVGKPLPDRLFWADHSLDFKGSPLSEVFALVEKYYGVKVRVSDPGIYNCRLYATFLNDPADSIMKVIAESFSLHLTVDGNNYYLSGDACNK